MKLNIKALLLVALTIGVLTLTSVLVSRHSISTSFSALEASQSEIESERAKRLLDQQLAGLSATLTDYAYWSDTAEFTLGTRASYFTDNFATDNMKSLGISQVLVMDSVGRALASAELSEESALRAVSEAMVQTLRALAVPVLSDRTSQKVMRTYLQRDGTLYLVAVAAVRSQFEPGTSPKGALAMVRRFDAEELTRFGDILMHPVRLSFPNPVVVIAASAPKEADNQRLQARAPIADHEGQLVAELILERPRDLHRAGQTLALVAATQVALAGLVVGFLLIVLLDRLILQRLGRVHKELKFITDQGLEGNSLVQEQGSDELSDVASGINQLLTRVRADAAHQREVHTQQETLQLQLLQSQKTEALGRFTSGIAHDFNNSLAAIKGWVLLAREDLPWDHPSTESLSKALESIRYGDGLMRQLLTFSRQKTPKVERFQLGKLVQETRELVALGLMGRCVLDFHRDTTDDWVRADPTQIKQVVVNLLINACDAMNGNGTITLRLSACHLPPVVGDQRTGDIPARRYVQLSVKDSGPGIPQENLNRIFEPFFTTKAPEKGTGLGLSVAHNIMARHHGSISVTSEAGQGACFVLMLPNAAPDSNQPDTLQTKAENGTQIRRILYAEDDAGVRTSWSELLERQGWHVTQACDGEEAWQRFQSAPNSWDLILTDLAMPELNGLELANRIGRTERPPPMVLISAHAMSQGKEELRSAGFAHVLHKPVEQDELLSTLSDVISNPT